jgi:hypothetical protein
MTFSTVWTTYKVWIITIGAAVLLGAGVLAKDKIGGWWHNHQQAKYEKQINDLEQKNKVLESDNDQLRGQIKQDIANGDARDLQIDALNKELEKYGKDATRAAAAQQQAFDQYKSDIQNISVDATKHDRCLSYCSERASVGYACRPTVQQYCAQFDGQ